MDGLLIIDKPEGLTSHDVVARVRRILKTKRVGHTGTLDPFATGVMVLLVGQATRLAQFLDKDLKEYEAVVQFGFETDTGDRTGTPREVGPEPASVDIEAIKRVIPRFLGKIEQVPPMYSAKKVEGKKLYELARKGEVVERKSVPITIHELEIEAFDNASASFACGLFARPGHISARWLRTLGARSVSAAHLAELRRTRAGRFAIADALSLSDLENADDPAAALIPMETAVEHLPAAVLNDERVVKTRNGLSSRFPAAEFADGEAVRMVDPNAGLIAIGTYRTDDKTVQPKIVFGLE